ncbi:MAG: RNA polymerase sigma factor [Pyrinomonadaceae bacterium]
MSDSTTWQNELLIPCAENSAATETGGDTQTADCRLIKLVLAGDETAFEEMFEKYKRLVAAIAARYFSRPEQIEEVIQISFARVYFELENFRGEHDFSLVSWLGKITTNICLDILKKQQRKPENLLCELSETEKETLLADLKSDGKTEENLIERDLAEKLLAHLPTADRALLQMLYAEEMSVKQISEITGWSISKIKVRAFRARKSLRKVLRKFL